MGIPGQVIWIFPLADAGIEMRVFDGASSGKASMAKVTNILSNRRCARSRGRFARFSSHHGSNNGISICEAEAEDLLDVGAIAARLGQLYTIIHMERDNNTSSCLEHQIRKWNLSPPRRTYDETTALKLHHPSGFILYMISKLLFTAINPAESGRGSEYISWKRTKTMCLKRISSRIELHWEGSRGRSWIA